MALTKLHKKVVFAVACVVAAGVFSSIYIISGPNRKDQDMQLLQDVIEDPNRPVSGKELRRIKALLSGGTGDDARGEVLSEDVERRLCNAAIRRSLEHSDNALLWPVVTSHLTHGCFPMLPAQVG